MSQQNILDAFKSKSYDETNPMARTFIANIFAYMFAGLAISGVVSWVFANSPNLWMKLINPLTGDLSGLGYVVMFAPLIIALAMQMAYHRLSFPVLVGMFLLYAVLIGASLCFIFLIYTTSSLVSVFAITAGMFGGMAVLGYFTKIDLTKFGGIMMMLFWGMFIASMVNFFFIESSKMDWIISFIGIFVFTGLTAFKMQQFKYM
ncbi:MAG: Bax inhibitor-1/YccA family protein, partial [Flavobacteriales bacterium]